MKTNITPLSGKYLLLVQCLLTGITFLAGCDRNEQKTPIADILRPVRTLTITAHDNRGRDFTGVVDAIKKANLSFRVSGKLADFLVKEGDRVKQGQIIAQLDQTDFKIVLNSKQAAYESAQSDYERGARLLQNGHISRSDYDKLKSQFSSARSQLQAAEQDLKYTVLRASFAGYIAKRYVENFEEVNAKQEIVTLQDISSLLVKINIPETLMARVKRRKINHRFYAKFSAMKDMKFPLSINEVSTRADEKDQTYEINFIMQAPDNFILLPGMTTTVVIERENDTNTTASTTTIYVPAQAVLEDRQGRYVYLAVPEKDNKAVVRRKSVTVGRLTVQGLQITSGLQTGDLLITAGMSRLTEGKQVRLMEGAM